MSGDPRYLNKQPELIPLSELARPELMSSPPMRRDIGKILPNPVVVAMNPHSGLLENSTSANNFEDAGTEHGELYRCRDCNRKCKSKASYLKHRSMMCTHRLGPLTLECRYCKRHYTYAGYLQRHEIECAKAHNA